MSTGAPEPWDTLLRGLASGDDDAYEEFWSLYGDRLTRIIRRRLTADIQPRLAPEDVVQSVCRTFVRRVQGGQIQLLDRERLWRLLCAVALNKMRMQARFQHQARRSPGRERASREGDNADWLAAPSARSPVQEAIFAEQLQQLLQTLNHDEQQIVQLRLEGWESFEIAKELKCSERTVRRLTKNIRDRLKTWLISGPE